MFVLKENKAEEISCNKAKLIEDAHNTEDGCNGHE